MGKTRKNLKYAVNSSQKQSLDEQLTSGRVVRSKNKVKIRMRVEEDEVRTPRISQRNKIFILKESSTLRIKTNISLHL